MIVYSEELYIENTDKIAITKKAKVYNEEKHRSISEYNEIEDGYAFGK